MTLPATMEASLLCTLFWNSSLLMFSSLKLFSSIIKSTTWLFLAGLDTLSVIVTRKSEVSTLIILLTLQGIPSSLLIIDDGHFRQELLPCQILLLYLLVPIMYSTLSVSHEHVNECWNTHFPKESFQFLEFDNILPDIPILLLVGLTSPSNSVRGIQLCTPGLFEGVFQFGP